MIDGIKIYYSITSFDEWKRTLNINLSTSTDIETGEIKSKTTITEKGTFKTITHNGKMETYFIKIKETYTVLESGKGLTSYVLIIDGSLHKNFKGNNYKRFTWSNLRKEIAYLEVKLNLKGSLAKIANLEIGLNISLPFPVFPFLESCLLSYKGIPFNRYDPDRNGISLGYVCHLTQYSLKIYDKGKQNNLSENLMRIELRYLKMQPLKNRGIKCLSDLNEVYKIKKMQDYLIKAWNNVLLYDTSINLYNGSVLPQDIDLLTKGLMKGYWENLKKSNKRKFNYYRDKFRQTIDKYGSGYHNLIKEQIKCEWENHFTNCTNLPLVINNKELYNLTIKVNGKSEQHNFKTAP